MAKNSNYHPYTHPGAFQPIRDMSIDDVMPRLATIEGFRGEPYQDATGRATIGFGCRLPINRREAETLARMRMDRIYANLLHHMGNGSVGLRIRWDLLPQPLRRELLIAAFNLGATGLAGFVKMWGHVADGRWLAAADEVKDSAWWRNPATQHRAERLRECLRSL